MDGNLYLLQYGSFINKLVMEENIEKLDDYVIYTNDDKYYVFIGATTYYENALLLKEKYEEKGIYTYIKNDYINDKGLLKKINNIDKEVIKNKNLLENKNQEILSFLRKYYN